MILTLSTSLEKHRLSSRDVQSPCRPTDIQRMQPVVLTPNSTALRSKAVSVRMRDPLGVPGRVGQQDVLADVHQPGRPYTE